MEQKEIRLLTAGEIDVRVAQTTSYDGVVKVNLLLYKDARVDMRILDELYGPMGWKRTHQLIGDRLYCTIEVRDPATGEWIAKQDVGTESNTEPEKGQASDAFKRAGFNWGIGRELYTAPKIQVTLNAKEYRDNGGRIQVWAAFSVRHIDYDANRNISELVIVDRQGSVRFEMGPRRSRASKKEDNVVDLNDVPIPANVPENTYWNIVSAYAENRPTKAGGDYRETFIKEYQPSDLQIRKFDLDVDKCRAAKAGKIDF